jgi:hypothetical protein
VSIGIEQVATWLFAFSFVPFAVALALWAFRGRWRILRPF